MSGTILKIIYWETIIATCYTFKDENDYYFFYNILNASIK